MVLFVCKLARCPRLLICGNAQVVTFGLSRWSLKQLKITKKKFAFISNLCYFIYMNEISILSLESRIDSINNAIAQMRRDATDATRANVEMAIEMLALPELEKVEAELAEAKDKFAKMSKFLSNPIFSKEVK